jgi:hypothetical protein
MFPDSQLESVRDRVKMLNLIHVGTALNVMRVNLRSPISFHLCYETDSARLDLRNMFGSEERVSIQSIIIPSHDLELHGGSS